MTPGFEGELYLDLELLAPIDHSSHHQPLDTDNTANVIRHPLFLLLREFDNAKPPRSSRCLYPGLNPARSARPEYWATARAALPWIHVGPGADSGQRSRIQPDEIWEMSTSVTLISRKSSPGARFRAKGTAFLTHRPAPARSLGDPQHAFGMATRGTHGDRHSQQASG